MVKNFEVRQLCRSISFFFGRLGLSLGSFSTHCPTIEGFVSRDSSLGLYPFLYQYLNWFKELVGEREMVSEVRSNELETGILSSVDPVKAKVDTSTSGPASSGQREIRSFHALREECALDADTFFKFRDRFQFPKKFKIHCSCEGDKAYALSLGEVCFHEAAFQCVLRFPVRPSIYHGTPEPFQHRS